MQLAANSATPYKHLSCTFTPGARLGVCQIMSRQQMKRQKSGSTSAMEKEPGFGHMWQNPKFQDMVIRVLPVATQPAPVIIKEEEESQEGPSKRQKTNPEVLQDIAANKTLLASVSNYWVTRIDRWDQQADSTKSLKLDEGRSLAVFEESIEPQDLPVVQAAVQFAYTRQVEGGIAELMQAVRLADKWAMPGYMTACLKELSKKAEEELTVQDINVIMADDLPPGVLQHAMYHATKQTCAWMLVSLFARPQQLYNSEDEQILADFRGLSFATLLHWAQQDKLRVDSENTVAVLITDWWQHNMSKTHGCSEEIVQQRKEQLSSALRVQHLTASFFVDVLPQLPWFTSKHASTAFSLIQLSKQLKFSQSDVLALRVPPAWFKGIRKAADQEFTYEWEVTKGQLEQLHEDAGNGGKFMWAPKPFFWKGVWWRFGLSLDSQSSPLCLALEAWARSSSLCGSAHTSSLCGAVLQCPTVMTTQLEIRCLRGDRSPKLLQVDTCFGRGFRRKCFPDLLRVPAASAPRTSSQPPARLMPDDQLHLQLVMQGLDGEAGIDEGGSDDTSDEEWEGESSQGSHDGSGDEDEDDEE